METLEREAQPADLREQRRYLFGVDTERLRSATHLHARTLQFEIWIDTHGHPRRPAESRRDPGERARLAEGFDIQQHAGGNRLDEFLVALAGPGEADPGGRTAGVERGPQLARRCDVESVDQSGHVPDQRRHRIGLHRVVQLDVRRQRLPQFGDAGGQQCAVVGIERGLPDAGREPRERHAANDEFAVLDRELAHRGVDRGRSLGGSHGIVRVFACSGRHVVPSPSLTQAVLVLSGESMRAPICSAISLNNSRAMFSESRLRHAALVLRGARDTARSFVPD